MSGNILVGVIMGSQSDWDVMQHCTQILNVLKVSFEAKIVSAHRTPDLLFAYAASAFERGVKIIIAGAGGAAHLPGMIAAKTTLPVLGVPIAATQLNGLDALMSIVQMPAGCPVGTLAIGKSGAINAALLAASILGLTNSTIAQAVLRYRQAQTEEVLSKSLVKENK